MLKTIFDCIPLQFHMNQQEKDRLVVHFWIRFVRWQIEYGHRPFMPTGYEAAQQFKRSLPQHLAADCRNSVAHSISTPIIRFFFSCCPNAALIRFDGLKIHYLLGCLTEFQQSLVLGLLYEVYGDYYRENIIYEFERSTAPIINGDRGNILRNFNCFSD